ncbi:MAG: signal peptidase I [Chloroflexota bacterium]|nr:MAG: signal peptidase I [Chloroflexota bacterium]
MLLVIAVIAGMWQIFEKAGEAGWKAIIPFYNIWVLLEIVGRPGWWLILYFIPVVGFVIWVIMMIDLAKSFDHGIGFAIGLMILPVIFVPLLGFSEMQYYGPAAKS